MEWINSTYTEILRPRFELLRALWGNTFVHMISEWQLWLICISEMGFLSFWRYYLLLWTWSSEFKGTLASALEGTIKSPVRADLRIFYFPHYKGISILLSFLFFPCFVALGNLHTSILRGKKNNNNDSNFFSFRSPTSHVSASFSSTCKSDRRWNEKWKRAVD